MAFETISLGSQPAGTGGDTARTAFEKVNRNFIAADVLAAAMSQAQFEANRNANKELYAASGWVSFGNHESGKQVNECKPGLYTALTTPNTLLIGNAGGLGGSKTDYASVHIDGVIFNFTNQFVLTLPSHPTSGMPERMDMYGVEAEKVEISAASPNAYQGGLRGVGAAVNLFSATEQQKKDFFTQNSNTTFIGSDGKIYQWQVYKIAFAGSTDGVPSPTEQGYSLNSFGDLWLKAGKNLLYFGNVLRLNDGGYHPSFNPLGAAKFVGDTFWHNTAASITSRADCFNPSKLLTGSGSIASGKSGRPELDGRYYDAIYADGYGGVCIDMRWSANEVNSVDYAIAIKQVEIGAYRGFEKPLVTKFYPNANTGYFYTENANHAAFTLGPSASGGLLPAFANGLTQGTPVIIWQPATGKKLYGVTSDTSGYFKLGLFDRNREYSTHTQGLCGSDAVNPWFIAKVVNANYLVGGPFLHNEVSGNPLSILSNPNLAESWLGGFNPVIHDGSYKRSILSRDALPSSIGMQYAFTTNSGNSWFTGTLNGGVGDGQIDLITNTVGTSIPTGAVFFQPYYAFGMQTEPSINAEVYGRNIGDVFTTEDYRLSLLSETLFGKVMTSNAAGKLSFYQSVTGYLLDLSGKLSSTIEIEHTPITLAVPNNSSGGIKVISYPVNINQQGFIQFAYTELKHNGINFGDDGKQKVLDNQSTKTDLNGNTVLVGTAKLKEPIGWIKNKV